jgi:hypothetical protein
MTLSSKELTLSIQKLRNSIKRKHRSLTHGIMEDERFVEKRLRPLSEPIKQLAHEIKRGKEDKVVKEEEEAPKWKEEAPKEEAPKEEAPVRWLKDEYIEKTISTSGRGVLDHTYGVKYDPENNKWVMGTIPITFHENNTIVLEDMKLIGTRGLFELLFMNNPRGYSKRDLHHYKEILVKSGAHLNIRRRVKSNSGFKYKKIIKKLFSKKTGGGRGGHRSMMIEDRKEPVRFVYWDDPNEMCNRLRTLIMSKEGGHTGHDMEIISIIEELREKGYIVSGELKAQYRDVA